MAVVCTYVGILTVDVVFFRSPGVFRSQDSFPSTFCPRLCETFSGVVAVGVFAAEARRELWAHPSRLHLIYVVHAYCCSMIGQHSDTVLDGQAHSSLRASAASTPTVTGGVFWNHSIEFPVWVGNNICRLVAIHSHLYLGVDMDPRAFLCFGCFFLNLLYCIFLKFDSLWLVNMSTYISTKCLTEFLWVRITSIRIKTKCGIFCPQILI